VQNCKNQECRETTGSLRGTHIGWDQRSGNDDTCPANESDYFHWMFFGLIFLYLFVCGRINLPFINKYPDPVGIRDAGCMLSYLWSQPNPVTTTIIVAMKHVEGAFQYFFVNVYCYLVGDIFPLTPATMQFPNTVFASLTAVFAYLLGKKIDSPRLGYCCALAFVFSPWLADTIRAPWYFNTFTCLMHYSTIYFLFCLMESPKSKFYGLAFAVCLAIYIQGGLDWPSFMFCLFVFVAWSGRMREILFQPYNILPVISVSCLIFWTLCVFHYEGKPAAMMTLLLYPFHQVGWMAGSASFDRILKITLLKWGLPLILAVYGLMLYLRTQGKCVGSLQGRSVINAMVIWFLIATPALVSTSQNASYLYVAAMPTALMAGLALAQVRKPLLFTTVIAMAVFHILTFLTSTDVTKTKVLEKSNARRGAAAACFLIEHRPDMLSENKTAFLGGYNAGAVSNYARGRNHFMIMHEDFPNNQMMPLAFVLLNSPQRRELQAFVEMYTSQKKILANWLILDSELFSETNPSRGFYLQLRDDPNIFWIARFVDTSGGEMYIGEVSKGCSNRIVEAPLMDVNALFDTYEAKYDRISFLKWNVQFVNHY
jgi:hypothetical protein